MLDFGERFRRCCHGSWLEFPTAPAHISAGDLRLDQLFFAVSTDDPPVTAVDWRLTVKAEGAYDVGYFSESEPRGRRSAQLRGPTDRAVRRAPR